MKVEVVKRYVDKETKWLMEEGMKAEYSAERAKELISGGYVKRATDKKAKTEN